MQRSLKINGLYENPEENPLLEKFLGNKPKYCYDLQLHFLKMRKKLQIIGTSGEKSFVMDRSLPEDILVFCHQFYKDGILTKNELDSLSTQFKSVCNEIPSADLLIVLKGRSDLAWSRIQQRGREMEMEGGWTKSEIEALNQHYSTYAQDVRRFGYHHGKILEINVNKIDFTSTLPAVVVTICPSTTVLTFACTSIKSKSRAIITSSIEPKSLFCPLASSLINVI